MTDNKNLIQLWANDSKRTEFLNAYRDWEVWFTIPETEWTLYRYILPNGTAIIALEYRMNPNYYPKEKPGILYYIQEKGDFICPGYTSSIGYVANLLKDIKVQIQKEDKAVKQ